MDELVWFGGWLAAVAALFAASLPLLSWCWAGSGASIRAARVSLTVAACVGIAVFANVTLVRHDRQIDLTSEHLYTADEQLVDVARSLERPVQLTYFYRGDDPAGMRIRRIVEQLGRMSPMLTVQTSDPDVDPTLAQTAGVKLYNAALLEADGRRQLVQGTDEREIALGLQRLLGRNRVVACFLTGHNEYPSDNETFHTHVEALGGGHDHDHGAAAVVETRAHGIGRLRRSLEALGYDILETSLAIDGRVDPACTLVIDAGPRTPYSAIEVAALAAYVEGGGNALLLYDLDSPVSDAHAAWLKTLGVRLRDAVVIDPVQHYAGDREMVAATSYPPHVATANLSFTFFPGVRALDVGVPDGGATATAIVVSSRHAEIRPLHRAAPPHTHPHDEPHAHADDTDTEARSEVGPAGTTNGIALAVAVEGSGAAGAARPFRLVVVGDSDFASNSFYPYMSNSRLVLAVVRWLSGESGRTAIDARVDVRETIELTRDAQRRLFVVLVIVIPGLIALTGLGVWWRRR